MITAKKILDLSEKYYSAATVYGKLVPVYVNPTEVDIPRICKLGRSDVRFLSDYKNKKVYAWDAYLADHEGMRKGLGFYPRNKYPQVSDGATYIENNKFISFETGRPISILI